MSKLLKINKVRSFFQRRKQILVDSCCDTESACCEPGTGLRGYKVYYNDSVPEGIDNSSTLLKTINVGDKWQIYLETAGNDVNVTSITVTPTIAGLSINSTPALVTHPDTFNIVAATWLTTGTRTFTVNVITDSGNFSINVEIKVI